MNRNAVLLADFQDRFHGRLDSPLGSIHYESRGEAGRPTVVLIHGVSGPMSVWDANVEALAAAEYRVIRYDLFGRGYSQRLDTEAYGLPLYLEQLEVLLAGLEVQEPVILVGSSFGAIVATEYGLHHPDRVRGLVLVGPAGFPLETSGMARLRDVPLLGSALTRLFGRKAILDQNRKYLASYQELGRSRIPVGVIWGRQDVTFPYAHHETLLKAVPGARLVTVEGAAHLPQYERPEATNAALLELLGSFREEAAPGGRSEARPELTPEVNSQLSAEPVPNDALFEAPFFSRFRSAPLSLELAPGVVKDYLFPTFYAQVTSSMALFLASYEAAASLLPAGLRPMRALPGKALVAISSYHYGAARGMAPYNEIAVSVLLSPSRAYVVSMPVSSEENRIRGRTLWGLPKEVHRIRLRQVGAEWVTTLQDAQGRPSIELRVPKEGRTRPLPASVTVVSKKGEALLEGTSSAEGKGVVSYFAGRLWLSGDSEDVRLLRKLQLSQVALRTQVATGVRSTFSLPERVVVTSKGDDEEARADLSPEGRPV